MTGVAARQYRDRVRHIVGLLDRGRAGEAAAASLALYERHPESNDALLLLGKARQQQGRFDEMLDLVATALKRDPGNVQLQLQYAGACHFCGRHDAALRQFEILEKSAGQDPVLLQKIAEAYSQAGRHAAAHACYERVAALGCEDPRFLYNRASSAVAMGELRQAEALYSAVIARQPGYGEAWYSRSTLRRQTPGDNHVAELEAALARLSPDDAAVAWLYYALAREYEDLGDDEQSFACLERGAARRQRELNYDVRADVAGMRRLRALFDRGYAERTPAAAPAGDSGFVPVFVLGLPRSGTTLVDRIISSHSRVESMGELTDLSMALARLGGTLEERRLLEAYAGIEPARLAAEYRRSVASYGVAAPYLVDKMPANFLYIGLIAKALPDAPIVHVRRHPLDSCLGMYRTMFRKGYPFSYSLESIAEYYIAYDELMRHWHAAFPGAVIDVSYEALVEDQAETTRALIGACGLPWEPGCLAFEENRAPVMTASAAQVRQPVYRDALARWRRFADRLAPLITRLEQAGIAL